MPLILAAVMSTGEYLYNCSFMGTSVSNSEGKSEPLRLRETLEHGKPQVMANLFKLHNKDTTRLMKPHKLIFKVI